MTILHHPMDTTLAAFAGGTLDEGRSLVIATHLTACPACRRQIKTFECVGGALFDSMPLSPMGADALAQTLARLDSPSTTDAVVRSPARLRDETMVYPQPLSHYELGAWRRIGRGVYTRSVSVPRESGTRVFMLKAGPGTRLPRHTHTGTELTCVLKGAFRHDHGRYGPGDVDDADDTMEHRPRVETGEECVCLVALQGQVQVASLMGRLLRPFVRRM
jgi:putative transcriptional regulator